MELTITLGVVAWAIAIGAVVAIIAGIATNKSWPTYVGFVALALVIPTMGVLFFGWSPATAVIFALLVAAIFFVTATHALGRLISIIVAVALAIALIIVTFASPNFRWPWANEGDDTFDAIRLATFADIQSANSSLRDELMAYVDEKVEQEAAAREAGDKNLQAQINDLYRLNGENTVADAKMRNDFNDTVKGLQGRTSSVTKDNTTVTGSPVDMTDEAAANAVAEMLFEGGLNEGEFRVGTTHWSEFTRSVVASQAFSSETTQTPETIIQMVKAPVDDRQIAFSNEREKAVKAEAEAWGLDVDKEWERYLAGRGIIAVQYLVPIEYTGNGYYDKATRSVKYSTKKIRHDAGEVVFFYVASNGKVMLSASDRAACTNPSFDAAPQAAGRKPRPKVEDKPVKPDTPPKVTPGPTQPAPEPEPEQPGPEPSTGPEPGPSKPPEPKAKDPSVHPTPGPSQKGTAPPATQEPPAAPRGDRPDPQPGPSQEPRVEAPPPREPEAPEEAGPGDDDTCTQNPSMCG